MYPLWQHRPHGILVHYSVAVCAKKKKTDRKKWKEKNNNKPHSLSEEENSKSGWEYFLGSGSFSGSSPSTAPAEAPGSPLRVRLSFASRCQND